MIIKIIKFFIKLFIFLGILFVSMQILAFAFMIYWALVGITKSELLLFFFPKCSIFGKPENKLLIPCSSESFVFTWEHFYVVFFLISILLTIVFLKFIEKMKNKNSK